MIKENENLERIAKEIMRPVGLSKNFILWMSFLGVILAASLVAYAIQLQNGLTVTGMRDYVSWGMYIANFVFFVATSLVGMLITSVLGLTGISWIKPIGRIAEIIAVAFAAVAGLVIVSDMGRPDRLINVFMYGRIQSPIIWDVTVVITYLTLSTLLYFLPLIPDLAIAKTRMDHCPVWLQKLYEILSVKWGHTTEQYKIMLKSVRILMVVIVPTAFAIHTVTSWLFASTLRVGWDSTIFGPYFLTGAFVAGSAAVVIAMYVFRSSYKLEKYITAFHFDKMGKLLVLTMLVYLYFNINEYLVPAYKMKAADAKHLHELFVGSHAFLFWSVQLCGLIIPIILLIFKPFRKPVPMLILSIVILIGAWFKRLIIVVPTMEEPFLPKQHVPHEFMVYTPTVIESMITIGTIVMAIMIISILSKLFPVIPIWEMAEEAENESEHKLNE